MNKNKENKIENNMENKMENNMENKMENNMENNVLELVDDGKQFNIINSAGRELIVNEELFLDKNNFIGIINAVKDIANNLIADVSEDEGIKQRKILAAKISKLKNAIENRGKEIAAELKRKPKIIDATRKTVFDSLEKSQQLVLAPIKAIEQRKKEIEEIINLPASGIGCNVYGLEILLEQLKEKSREKSYWVESYKEAITSIIDSTNQITSMLDNAKREEKEKQELEELRLNRIKFEIAEKEKLEKEANELKKEKERLEKEADDLKKEKEKLEKRANEAELSLVPDFAKNDSENTKKEMLFPDNELEYKRACNREALNDLVNLGLNEELAKKVITEIVKCKVKHIRFYY